MDTEQLVTIERARYNPVTLPLSPTKELLQLAEERHEEIERGNGILPIRLLEAYAVTLLNIRDVLNYRIAQAEKDENGLPIVRDRLPRLDPGYTSESQMTWEPGTPLAGKLEAFHPFQYEASWEKIARIAQARTVAEVRRLAVNPRGCDPPESCEKKVRAIAPKFTPTTKFHPPRSDARRIKPFERKINLKFKKRSLKNAISLSKQVTVRDAYASFGLKPPEFLKADSSLNANMVGIYYIGPGFAAYFKPNGDIDESPVGSVIEVDAVTNSAPGIYWRLPEGKVPNIPTVRLDRGKVEAVSTVLSTPHGLRVDEKDDLKGWLKKREANNKRFLVILSKSYRRRGSVFSAPGRLKRAATASFRYLEDQIERNIINITKKEIIYTVIFAVLGKIPGVNLAFIHQDVADAEDFGRAAGMAAWETADEDIDISGRLMAGVFANMLVGKVKGKVGAKVVRKVRKLAPAVLTRRQGPPASGQTVTKKPPEQEGRTQQPVVRKKSPQPSDERQIGTKSRGTNRRQLTTRQIEGRSVEEKSARKQATDQGKQKRKSPRKLTLNKQINQELKSHGLDDRAITRVRAEKTQSKKKGQLLEETFSAEVKRLLAKGKHQQLERLLRIKIPRNAELIDGYRIRDADNKPFTDGLLMVRDGDRVTVLAAFEAKSGLPSSKKLVRKTDKKTKKDEFEKMKHATEEFVERNKQFEGQRLEDVYRENKDAIDAIARMLPKSEAGQMRQTYERLDPNEDVDFVMIRIDGKSVQARRFPRLTIVAVLPKDIPSQPLKEELENIDLPRFSFYPADISAKELDTLATGIHEAETGQTE